MEVVLEHISTKPWSDFKESDYSLEQWHNACLIHLHDGPPTSKAQCKLPVKTPDGVLNKNGVFAAAAALAGARTALQAPIAKKAQAARKLIAYYQQMNAKPPPSLFSLGHSMETEAFLEHHGIKGQKWGIRNEARLQRARRVGAGKASVKDVRKFSRQQSLLSLVRGRGVEGAAKNEAIRLAARKKRIQSGQARVSDILATHGGMLFVNLGGTG